MKNSTELCLEKLVEDSILMKGQINDVIFGIQQLSGKLDTLIALKQVELGRQQPQLQQQYQKESL